MRLIFIFFLFLSSNLLGMIKQPEIVIDPGHGGKDWGAKMRGCEEKYLTLKTSYLVKRHLEALGYKVVMTRARDHFLPLATRVKRANRRPTSLFVSIHYNSAKTPVAQGIEVYYYGKGDTQRRSHSKDLANAILSQTLSETKGKSRGVKRGNFQVIRETVMPAVLVEGGFLTNAEERAKIKTEGYLDKLAKGVALGIEEFVQSRR